MDGNKDVRDDFSDGKRALGTSRGAPNRIMKTFEGFDLLNLIAYWIDVITHVINTVMMILSHIPALQSIFHLA